MRLKLRRSLILRQTLKLRRSLILTLRLKQMCLLIQTLMHLHFVIRSTIQTHLLKSKNLLRLIVIHSMRHSMMLTLILKRLMMY